MNPTDVERRTLELMTQYGLTALGWRFQWDRAKKRFGLCSHRRRVISLSRHLVRINTPEETEDTIRHEIAHALVGTGQGHNWRWRLKARELGARPQRCASGNAKTIPGHWVATCVGCGTEFNRHKRPPKRRLSCGKCSHRFDERFVLVWTRKDGAR